MGALYQGPDPLGLGPDNSDSGDTSSETDVVGGAEDWATGTATFLTDTKQWTEEYLGADVPERDGPAPTQNKVPFADAITGVGSMGGLLGLGKAGSTVAKTLDDVPNAAKVFGGGAAGGVALDDAMEGGLPNPFPPLLPQDRNKQNNESGGGDGQMMTIAVVVIAVLLLVVMMD